MKTKPGSTRLSALGGHKLEARDISRGAHPSLTAIWESRNSVLLDCYSGFCFQEKLQGRIQTMTHLFQPSLGAGTGRAGGACSLRAQTPKRAPSSPGRSSPRCSASQGCVVGQTPWRNPPGMGFMLSGTQLCCKSTPGIPPGFY